MRKSKLETAQTRERIVASAAAEFREHGIVSTGLNELMASAGLTHGGFYRHFLSKDDLVVAAIESTVESMVEGLEKRAMKAGRRKGLKSIAARYLSVLHRDHPGKGCPLAAIGSELGRTSLPTREKVTAAVRRWVEILSTRIDGDDEADSHRKALAAASTMIGAMTLARIVSDDSLSKSFLNASAEMLAEL